MIVKSTVGSMARRKGGFIVSLLLALVLVMGMMLTGCSSSNEESSSSEANSNEPEASDGETYSMTVGLFSGSYLSVPVLVAKNLGYFEEEGLDIDWQSISGDGTTMVSTGDLDVYCTSYTGALSAMAQGDTNICLVGGEMSEGCDYVVLEDYEGVIESPEDFEGLVIGACAGDPGLSMTKVVLDEAGVNATFVELSSIEDSITALLKGEVDLSIVCGASSYDAIQDGCKVLAKVSDIAGTFPCCRLQANTTFVDENSEALVQFLRAALRGYETYVNDPETTCEVLAEVSSQNVDTVRAKMYGTDDYDTPMKVSIDPEANAILNAYETFIADGIIPESDVDITQFLRVEAYGTALQSLIDEEPDNDFWVEMMEAYQENNSSVL